MTRSLLSVALMVLDVWLMGVIFARHVGTAPKGRLSQRSERESCEPS